MNEGMLRRVRSECQGCLGPSRTAFATAGNKATIGNRGVDAADRQGILDIKKEASVELKQISATLGGWKRIRESPIWEGEAALGFALPSLP